MAHWKDVVAAFTAAGVLVSQARHPTNQAPPYAVAWRNGESRLASDNVPLSEYEIYLYTEQRDMALEFSIEDELSARRVSFTKGPTGHDAESDLVSIPFRDISVQER